MPEKLNHNMTQGLFAQWMGRFNGLPPYFLAIAGLITTLILTREVYLSNENILEVRFDRLNTQVLNELRSHTEAYESALLHARGLYNASEKVSRAEFKKFVDSMEIMENYPGIQGLGFAEVVPQKALDEHLLAVRKDGFGTYNVWPPGPRDLYYVPIVFLEPFNWRNRRAFGFDMFSEPMRRSAMERARDSGHAALTKKVTLLQETEFDKHVGFLIYLPVYRSGTVPERVEDRRKDLVGFVFAPFRSRDLFEAITQTVAVDELMEVEIFEKQTYENSPENLIFDSNPASKINDRIPMGTFMKTTDIQFGGETWTIQFRSLPTLHEFAFIAPHWLILIGGLISTFLIYRLGQAYENYNRNIRLSETRLQTITDTLPALVVHVDSQGHFLFANAAHFEWFGITPEEMKSMTAVQFSEVTGSQLGEKEQEAFRRVFAGEPLSFETVFIHRVLGPRPMRIDFRPIFEKNGRPNGFVALATDLQDQKNLAKRLERDKLALEQSEERHRQIALENERLYREAQSVNQAKDQFLATLSHELRTPINVIQGHAELLAADLAAFPQHQESIDAIFRNAQTQAQLVEDLLEVSSIITGKAVLRREPLLIESVIERSIESIKLAAQKKRVTIETDLSPSSRVINGDATRLQQVVWNLLTNAIKFTPENGVIKIAGLALDNRYQIRVKDSGQGIEEKFIPFVFDRFRQEDNSSTRRYGGLGIGLSIARNLVEMHGGRIWVESQGRNKGSTFVFEIPFAAKGVRISQKEIVSKASAQAAVHQAPGTLTDVKILIVDDESDSRRLLQRYLEKASAQVRSAASAQEATVLYHEFQPDLIISDISMPDEDGYSMIKRFRQDEGISTPAIALTAYAREEDKLRALAAGYQSHLSKPVTSASLIQEARDTLKKKVIGVSNHLELQET